MTHICIDEITIIDGWAGGVGGGETPMVECIHLSLYVFEWILWYNIWWNTEMKWPQVSSLGSLGQNPTDILMYCHHCCVLSAYGTHFTKSFSAHDWNLEKILFALILIIQSGHYFAHVMTAQLSWHVQNCDLIGLLFLSNSKVIFFQVLDYKVINTWWFGSLGGVSKTLMSS